MRLYVLKYQMFYICIYVLMYFRINTRKRGVGVGGRGVQGDGGVYVYISM